MAAFLNRFGNLLKQNISRHVSSEFSASNGTLFQAMRKMSTSSKVFVGGLSYSTDEMSLRESFSQYGEVIEARIIMDRETGRSRGFAFVTFTSSESASSAIQALDGQDIHGRRVRVNYATEKPRGGDFGGGYGAGGGGGGYNYGGQGGNYGRGGYGGGDGGYGGGSGYGGGNQYPSGGYRSGGGSVDYGSSNQYPSGGGGFGSRDNYPSSEGGFGSASNLASGGDYASNFSGNQSGFAAENDNFQADKGGFAAQAGIVDENSKDDDEQDNYANTRS